MLKKYMFERNIPETGPFEGGQFRAAAARSDTVLRDKAKEPI